MGESFTIQLSSKLIDQIANGETKVKKRVKKPKPKIPVEPPLTEKNVKPAPTTTQTSSPMGGWPLPPVFISPPPPPPISPTISELEAIRSVVQESEKTVEKLEKQEDKMIQELNQRAKDLRDKEFKLPYQNPTICTAERAACLSCYQEHVKDPLKCAQAVRNFADCVRQTRIQRYNWMSGQTKCYAMADDIVLIFKR
ncbi:hypothetical protein ZIOFF_044467 [Zingiber officinale]|uniref:Uncharacterized protein n=1 Tax=Zingiber officinale TaxID=94328 RepID=A0A8J5KUH1_ZINOF|nr:hypothetical protein ZIOFF_044467 [Zingiber officinale]